MSPSAKKPVLVRRSVVELDLVGYSLVARDLEKQTDATVLFHLNDQVQGFVDDGLSAAGCARKDVVNGTAGDNALLAFERATEAHRFSEAVHRATAKHNATKTDPAAHRHFRIGISTGEIGVRGKEISGTRIIDSVRLEAAGKKGHILIDEATYEELSGKFQQCYSGPEIVADKQNNSYSVYRCIVGGMGDCSVFAPGIASLRRDSVAPAGFSCPVDMSRIIKYAPSELIGREAETKLLNDVWDKAVRGETKRPHVLTFVALGGEGKTSLVAKWAAELAFRDWPGCDAVFAWSFYSQGTREQTAVSSDSFLAAALTFFGDAAMAGSPQSAFDKGRRVAQLVGERRALLILDGVEPLQYSPRPPMEGKLKDGGLAELLKGLAAQSHGLCIVTTRYAVPDLRAYWKNTAPMHELPRLSRAAGVELLQRIGVQGSLRKTIQNIERQELLNEFENLVEDVDGHALTLQILGQFLVRAFHGDIRRRDCVRFEKADAKIQGGHAFRAMEAYVKWLEDDSEEARREVVLLKLLGLFDRPATAACLTALRQEPPIPGLTDPLVGLGEDDWEFCLSSLRDAKLLTVNRDTGSGELIALDAHPLLREYFAQRVRQQQPEAWRDAHRRLYEHLSGTTPDKEDPTLEDLLPLYQAVAHGCMAELRQEACDKVFFTRIHRQSEAYSTRILGAFGSNLGAVACFFELPWSRVSPELAEADQAWLLNEAAYCLRGLGRLTEALDPIRVAGEKAVKVEQWKEAAVSFGNLSELELALGEVARAMADAEQSVTFADRSRDAFGRKTRRARVADALHQSNRLSESKTRFREAENIHAKNEPTRPLLYTLSGFQYCDLLLTKTECGAWKLTLRSATSARLPSPNDEAALNVTIRGSTDAGLKSCRAVSQRAARALKIAQQNNWLLAIGLDHLTLGRGALYEAILSSAEMLLGPNVRKGQQRIFSADKLSIACRELDHAVDGLRRAATTHHIPRGLLTRAWLRCLTDERSGPESAQTDLDEAWEIAERGPMRLHMADIHLYRARLFHGVKSYPWTSPQGDLAAARKLIEQCGYWRRKEELEDAETAAKNW